MLGLRELDDRLLPGAAVRLRRVVGHAGRGAGRVGSAVERALTALQQRPLVSGLALVVVIASLVVAAVVGRHGSAAPAATSNAAPVGFADVGPTAGQRVGDYLRAARHRLDHVAGAKDRDAYAVVDFARYVTAAEAARSLDGLRVSRAYFKVTVKGVQTQPHTAVVQSVAEVARAITATAKVEKAAASSFLQLSGAIPARTPTEKQVKLTYSRQAAIAQVEAKALTASCTCVYALVVRGQGSALKALAGRAGVRVVDPAPAGIPLEGLGVIPLLPETTGAITTPGRTLPPH